MPTTNNSPFTNVTFDSDLVEKFIDEISTIESLNQYIYRLVKQLNHHYNFICSAVLGDLDNGITLYHLAHRNGDVLNENPTNSLTQYQSFHPIGKKFLFSALEKIKNESNIKALCEYDGTKCFACLSLIDHRYLYIEANCNPDQLNKWNEFVIQLQNQLSLMSLFVKSYLKFKEQSPAVIKQFDLSNINLKQNESSTFNDIFDAIPIGIFRCSLNGDCFYANKKMLELMGMTQEQAQGEGWGASLHPDDLEDVVIAWQNMKDNGTPFKKEYRLKTPEGKVTWVNGAMYPAEVLSGGITEYFGTVVDINKMRETEEQLRMHHKQLANLERIHGMGEIASGLAHELNQPLSVISLYARECSQYFKKQQNTDERILLGLDKILSNARRSGEILHRINELFNKGTLQLTTANISTVIQQALDAIDQELLRNTCFNFEISSGDTILTVDVLQIEQVIINLIKNAYHAMAHLSKEESIITIKTDRDNQNYMITISDKGEGIPDNIKDKIHQPFFTSNNQNMGMGLAICQSIMTAHNGKCELIKSDQQGSSFVITIPLIPITIE